MHGHKYELFIRNRADVCHRSAQFLELRLYRMFLFFFLTLCHYHSHPVLQVRTDALPYALLETLKAIEHTVGRVPSIPNGPRAVDLDILFYDDAFFDSRPVSVKGTLEGLEGQLVIPHPRMAEREFVLRPLYELALSLPFHDQPLTVRAV